MSNCLLTYVECDLLLLTRSAKCLEICLENLRLAHLLNNDWGWFIVWQFSKTSKDFMRYFPSKSFNENISVPKLDYLTRPVDDILRELIK